MLKDQLKFWHRLLHGVPIFCQFNSPGLQYFQITKTGNHLNVVVIQACHRHHLHLRKRLEHAFQIDAIRVQDIPDRRGTAAINIRVVRTVRAIMKNDW